jgi:putative AlgH/UPF0301 family transcriptional regulator
VRLDPPLAGGNHLPLFIGGPVQPERGWILTNDAPVEPDFRTVLDGLYLSTSPDLLRWKERRKNPTCACSPCPPKWR